MFLKQTAYKPRQPSQSSGSDTTSATMSAAATEQPQSTNPGAAGRRRSSATEQFGGLHGYKRSSVDEKRTSYADQSQQSGVLGQMWNNFTKGTK